jgi:hypothetical protein
MSVKFVVIGIVRLSPICKAKPNNPTNTAAVTSVDATKHSEAIIVDWAALRILGSVIAGQLSQVHQFFGKCAFTVS